MELTALLFPRQESSKVVSKQQGFQEANSTTRNNTFRDFLKEFQRTDALKQEAVVDEQRRLDKTNDLRQREVDKAKQVDPKDKSNEDEKDLKNKELTRAELVQFLNFLSLNKIDFKNLSSNDKQILTKNLEQIKQLLKTSQLSPSTSLKASELVKKIQALLDNHADSVKQGKKHSVVKLDELFGGASKAKLGETQGLEKASQAKSEVKLVEVKPESKLEGMKSEGKLGGLNKKSLEGLQSEGSHSQNKVTALSETATARITKQKLLKRQSDKSVAVLKKLANHKSAQLNQKKFYSIKSVDLQNSFNEVQSQFSQNTSKDSIKSSDFRAVSSQSFSVLTGGNPVGGRYESNSVVHKTNSALLLKDLSYKVKQGMMAGKERMTIHLQPAHLGKVDVMLSKDKDRLHVKLNVESSVIKETLDGKMDALIRKIGEGFAGAVEVEVNVSQSGAGLNGDGREDSNRIENTKANFSRNNSEEKKIDPMFKTVDLRETGVVNIKV